ncbi:MAG: 6-bladed beta-propeller [Rhodocyclaceae bacterium]|nr:6-bladed beta-propeller [Rhodocyclaceae bacterium]
MWPPAPDIPRYQFAGQLIGENNFVRDADADGALVRLFRWIAGLASSNPVTLQRPQGIAVDAAGRVFVSDVSRAAVFVFDPVAGELRLLEYANGLQRFINPVGVVTDPDGSLWVADAELAIIAHLSPDGDPLPAIGKGQLGRPTGLVRNPADGHLLVADTQAHKILEFTPGGDLVRTIGERGHDAGQFNFPTYLALAGERLYVTDTMNSRVQILHLASGEFVQSVGRRGLYTGNLVRPKGVATDTDGNVYIVESLYDNLLIFNEDGQFLMPIGGVGKEIGKFYLPSGVAVDDFNRILVADTFNGRVVLFQYLGNTQ